MEARIDIRKVAPGAMNALGSLVVYVRKSGLEPSLVDLVNLRVSILEGCAYCIDAHTKDARARGETEQRLYAVAAWEATPFFTDRERAALAWTDSVTRISETHIPDEAFNRAREYFDEQELVDLTMAIIAITGWNRLATSFRMVPGSYDLAAVQKRLDTFEKPIEMQR